MATEYTWKSQKSADDIVAALRERTDRKRRGNPWSFRCRNGEGGRYMFMLAYDLYWRRSATYRRASLKGEITPSPQGCTIAARTKFRWENIWIYCIQSFFVVIGIAALLAGIEGAVWAALLAFLMAACSLGWHLFTYIQGKDEHPHVEIISDAAQAEPISVVIDSITGA